MNENIIVDDADYKTILSKGGRVERFSGSFHNNDSEESVLKPIMNDLKVETFKCDILISGLPEN